MPADDIVAIECTTDLERGDINIKVRRFLHGQDLRGINLVAVVQGTLHRGYMSNGQVKDDCDWCKDLRARCNSRRIA
jgi:hypothetical protein